jgi:hypothetical protein
MDNIIDEIIKSLSLMSLEDVSDALDNEMDISYAKQKIDEIAWEDLVDMYYDDPVGFSEDILCFYPDSSQIDIMTSILTHKRISIRAGQGVGKTACLACLIIWYMMFRYHPKVIATAPTANQLNIVLWPEISKWLNGSYAQNYLSTTKTFIYRIGHEGTSFGNAKTAAKKENMLGLHAENMLIVCDEAPGISDDILEALLGTCSHPDNRIILIGNPTRNSGIFFDSHNSLKDNFKCIKISARDCARTDKKNIEMMEKKYGKDSNVVRVLIDGEFPLEEDDVYIQLSEVMAGINNDIHLEGEPVTIDIGIDVARFGDDETVITPKINNIVPPLVTHRGKDTMKTAGAAIRLAKELHLKYPTPAIVVKVDDTGLGGGVTDRLKEIKQEENLKWLKVVPVKFGIPLAKGSIAYNNYYDTTTFMASVVKESLSTVDKEGKSIPCGIKLPNDSDLLGQLTNRKYAIHNSKGQIKLESKDEMKKRGLVSPDRADSLFLACMPVGMKVRQWDK